MNRDKSVNIIIQLLQESFIPVTEASIIEEFNKFTELEFISKLHMLFNYWRIPYQLVSVSADQLSSISTPFLTTLFTKGLVVVKKITNQQVIILDDRKKTWRMTLTDLGDTFNGVVITIDRNKYSGEPDYGRKRSLELGHKLRRPFLTVMILMVIAISVILYGNYLDSFERIQLLELSFKIAGVLITGLMLTYQFKKQNPFIEKICGSAQSGCSSLLTSDASELTPWMSWAELGLLYFSGTMLVVLFSSGNIQLLSLLALVNIPCLLFSFYSVFYQWRVLKQWCVLCCIIQALFWIDFLINPLNPKAILSLNWFILGHFTVMMLLPSIIWVVVKPGLTLTDQLVDYKLRFAYYKYNHAFFDHLLLQEKKVEDLPDQNTMLFGSRDTIKSLTLVLAPYCSHCLKMYEQLNWWLPGRSDISLNIVFNTKNETNRINVARHMIALYLEKGEKVAKASLDDWYLGGSISNYENWLRKYPVARSDFKEIDLILERQDKWCKQVEIFATPVLFLNNRKIPSFYKDSDLHYMM